MGWNRTRNNQNTTLKVDKAYGLIGRLKKGQLSQQWGKVRIHLIHPSELSGQQIQYLGNGGLTVVKIRT